ncbi:trihelix transcription factor GTL1 [Humulus lupulus]|uniref:trihelix transcription factor GTL1 n=1 Tax=Humulus lupulus TaxID=3486 RepID=UPI002B407CBF|nr:trihelix transcription factor GTL1 [Humulus lupulus]
MEAFAGDRQIPNSDDFPQLIAPFPEPTVDLIYAHPNAVVHSPDIINHRPISPPQKLRPIRCHVRSPVADVRGNVGLVETLAKGFLGDQSEPLDEEFDCAVKFETQRDDVGSGGSVSVTVDDPIQVGLGSFGEDWEMNGGERVVEDESSSSSDDEVNYSVANFKGVVNQKRRKSKRNIEHFLENMVTKVMEKQEEMHNQLIDMVKKMERERILREEAWKQMEMERRKRDELVRTQETSRSLALISFLQNLLGEEIQIPEPVSRPFMEENRVGRIDAQADTKCNSENKRWPEDEVQALIALRTDLEHKFQTTDSKGCIWEEISVGMYSMGYNRAAKKCKEKWDNMNKYFKKPNGSGKKRSANGKTCPYFRSLESLYKNGVANSGIGDSTPNNGDEVRSEKESGESPYTG